MVNTDLKQRNTFHTLVKIIQEDKDKLHYPNRIASEYFNSFVHAKKKKGKSKKHNAVNEPSKNKK